MASQLALPKKGTGSLLIAMMEPKTRTYNQGDATGFIRLNALRPASGIAALVHGKKK
jgi:hypothetical protein